MPQLEKILKLLLSNIKILLALALLVGYVGVLVYDRGPKELSAIITTTTVQIPRLTSTTTFTTTSTTTSTTSIASTTSSTVTITTRAVTPSPSPSRTPSAIAGKPPVVSSISIFQPNYCSAGAGVTITWGYLDPERELQSAYEVQIDDMSASWNVVNVKNNNASTSFYTDLSFSKNYKARVRVWDTSGSVSEWKESDLWATPRHAYPQVDFVWFPVIPAVNEMVQFTDRTVYSDGAGTGQRKWSWDFGDGESANTQNPGHYYAGFGTFGILSTVTDKDGYTCTSAVAKNITVRKQ